MFSLGEDFSDDDVDAFNDPFHPVNRERNPFLWWDRWQIFDNAPPSVVHNPKAHAVMVACWHRRMMSFTQDELYTWFAQLRNASNSPFRLDLFCYDTPLDWLKNWDSSTYAVAQAYHRKPLTDRIINLYFESSYRDIRDRDPDVTAYVFSGLTPDASDNTVRSVFSYLHRSGSSIIQHIPDISTYGHVHVIEACRMDMSRCSSDIALYNAIAEPWRNVWNQLLEKDIGDDEAWIQLISVYFIEKIAEAYSMTMLVASPDSHTLFFNVLPASIGEGVRSNIVDFCTMLHTGVFEDIAHHTDNFMDIVQKWLTSRFCNSSLELSCDLGDSL